MVLDPILGYPFTANPYLGVPLDTPVFRVVISIPHIWHYGQTLSGYGQMPSERL